MSEYDTGIWLTIRGPATILVTILLVVFLLLTQPQVSNPQVHADIIGARVAYNGGYLVKPGVVDAELFTQSTANQYLQANADYIQIPIGAAVRIMDITCTHPQLLLDTGSRRLSNPGDGEVPRTLIYNQFALQKVQGFWDAANRPGGVHQKEYFFPTHVQWDDGHTESGCLNIEVLYEQ